MLYTSAKKEALAIHERAAKKYNTLLEDFKRECEQLYALRQLSVTKIKEIESLINNITSTPKDFEQNLSNIKTERAKFRQTEEYAGEAYQSAIVTGLGVAAGVEAGAAIASMAPMAAMWVALHSALHRLVQLYQRYFDTNQVIMFRREL